MKVFEFFSFFIGQAQYIISLSAAKYLHFGSNFIYCFKKQFVYQTAFDLRIKNRIKNLSSYCISLANKNVMRRGEIDCLYAKQLLCFSPLAIITFSRSSLPCSPLETDQLFILFSCSADVFVLLCEEDSKQQRLHSSSLRCDIWTPGRQRSLLLHCKKG